MEKPAHAAYPLHAPIARRWSPVAFSGLPISSAEIGSLFEAARWAPSCYNEQPWRFLFATGDTPHEFERMLACLAPGNQVWARSAPLLILTFARLAFERNGRSNRHARHDVGLAAANLVLQATSMGLFAHQMAGFDGERIRGTYSVPDGVEPVTAIAVGYPGSIDDLPAELRTRESAPRSRKPLDSILFSGAWGEAPDFLKK